MDEYRLFAYLYDPLLYIALHKIRKKVVNVVAEYQPAALLDICCGTGNQLKFLRKNGFQNIKGIDISKAMLQQARKGDEKMICDEQDATKMKFPDNTFDMGLISFALHEKPYATAQKILAEAQRVIQTGGHLMIIDYMFDSSVKKFTKSAIHLVERFAGKEHYRYFKAYSQYGGMDRLMESFILKRESRFHKGATGMRVYQINKHADG
jgi:ubiquinone/menaquinone biosynthesis C-methylase UbiE